MALANTFYDQLTPHLLSDAQLRQNEYPMWLIDGQQVIVFENSHNSVNRPIVQDGDPLRICQRCGQQFDITRNAKATCVHHPQRQKIPRYLCCNGPPTRKGCTTLRYHVTHQFTAASLFQYVQAPVASADDARSKSVYALDAEFVYTASGSEIARLTLVDYDSTTNYYSSLCDEF
ncbi:Protein Y56A3A.33 [Aphelenchoides avenae]|nr:Protein Y56A3A.33 [Aphelenchus avenae]